MYYENGIMTGDKQKFKYLSETKEKKMIKNVI